MRIKAYVKTFMSQSKYSDEIEIDDEELEDLSEDLKEEYITEIVSEWKDKFCDWGWEVI
jgi:hypothetical protein